MRTWILLFGAGVLSAASIACSREAVTVPEGLLQSAEARQRGRALFLEHCAPCHGEQAGGRGVRSRGLVGRPADFSNAGWRRGVTPEVVFQIIRNGKRGTSMPGWPSLDDDQVWDLTAYALSVSEHGP